MRLHLNENTAGCSPAVLERLRALGRSDAGFYPEYDKAQEAVARSLGVPIDHILLTNGLDEGILAAAAAAFSLTFASRPPPMVLAARACSSATSTADRTGARRAHCSAVSLLIPLARKSASANSAW